MRSGRIRIAGFLLLVAATGLLCASVRRHATPTTAGRDPEPPTTATVQGVEVRVHGGFVRERHTDRNQVVVRATVPTPRIDLVSRSERPQRLRLWCDNVQPASNRRAARITQDGEAQTVRTKRDFRLKLAPKQSVQMDIHGPPTRGREFDFVFLEDKGTSLADVHVALRRLAADPPAFVVYHRTPAAGEDPSTVRALACVVDDNVFPLYMVSARADSVEAQRRQAWAFGPRRVAFEHGGVTFLLLGASAEDTGPRDAAWLDKQLAAGDGEVVLVLPRTSAAAAVPDALAAVLARHTSRRVCRPGAWPADAAQSQGRTLSAWRVRGRRGAALRVVGQWAQAPSCRLWRGTYRSLMAWKVAASDNAAYAWFGAAVLAGWAFAAAACIAWVVGRAGRLARRAPRAAVRGLAIATASAGLLWLYFGGLGAAHLISSNEGKRVKATYDMVTTGDYVVPMLNGRIYLHKPPLYYWVNSLFYPGRGRTSERAARASAVLAGLACLVVVYVAARRWFGPREALASAAILALSPLFFIQAREAELDMLLCTLTTLSLCLYLPALEMPGRRLGWWMAGSAALAGAMMTKGPVPLAIVVLTALCFLAWTRHGRPCLWPGAVLSLGVLAACLAPWGVAVVHRVGLDTGLYSLYEQSARRVGAASRINSGPWYFYLVRALPTLFAGGLWLPAAAVCGWRLSRRWRTERQARVVLYVGLWAVPSLIFFSACAGKEAQYILPLYPALSILCGVVAVRWMDGKLTGLEQRLFTLGTHLAAAVLVVVGVGGVGALAVRRAGLDYTSMLPLAVLLCVAIATAGLVAHVCCRRRGLAGLVLAFAIAFAAGDVLYLTEIVPRNNASASPRAFCRRAQALVPPDVPVYFYNDPLPQYAVYLDRVARYVQAYDEAMVLAPAIHSTTQPAYFLLREDDYDELATRYGAFGRVELATRTSDAVLLVANDAAVRHSPPGVVKP